MPCCACVWANVFELLCLGYCVWATTKRPRGALHVHRAVEPSHCAQAALAAKCRCYSGSSMQTHALAGGAGAANVRSHNNMQTMMATQIRNQRHEMAVATIQNVNHQQTLLRLVLMPSAQCINGIDV